MGRLALVACLGMLACSDDDVVSVYGDDGLVLEVAVARARTAAERMTGLRGRERLGSGQGLVLEFPVEDELCVTNRGVAYGIDVVFVTEDARVGQVQRELVADDPTIRCARARWLVEVLAGAASEVRAGHRVGGL